MTRDEDRIERTQKSMEFFDEQFEERLEAIDDTELRDLLGFLHPAPPTGKSDTDRSINQENHWRNWSVKAASSVEHGSRVLLADLAYHLRVIQQARHEQRTNEQTLIRLARGIRFGVWVIAAVLVGIVFL